MVTIVSDISLFEQCRSFFTAVRFVGDESTGFVHGKLYYAYESDSVPDCLVTIYYPEGCLAGDMNSELFRGSFKSLKEIRDSIIDDILNIK